MRDTELLERIRQQVPAPSPAFDRLRTRRHRKRRTARLAAGSFALVVAVAGVGAGILTLRPSREVDRTDALMPPLAGDDRLIAQPGEFYYLDVLRWDVPGADADTALHGPSRSQIWISPEGTGRVLSGGGSEEIDGVDLIASVADLSGDPDALYQELVERSSPGGASPNPIATTSPGRSELDTSLLRGVSDLLQPGWLTPTQQAGIPGAVARVEGVTVESGVRDPLGREAIRVTHVIDYDFRDGSRLEWYFDEVTGQFLGELWVDIQDGRVDNATIVAAAGIATSRHVPPAGADLSIPDASDVTPSFAA